MDTFLSDGVVPGFNLSSLLILFKCAQLLPILGYLRVKSGRHHTGAPNVNSENLAQLSGTHANQSVRLACKSPILQCNLVLCRCCVACRLYWYSRAAVGSATAHLLLDIVRPLMWWERCVAVYGPSSVSSTAGAEITGLKTPSS